MRNVIVWFLVALITLALLEPRRRSEPMPSIFCTVGAKPIAHAIGCQRKVTRVAAKRHR